MKKRYIVIGFFLMLLFGTIIGIAFKNNIVTDTTKRRNKVNDEINFVELFFPNVSISGGPLGNEVFAISFVVKEYQYGYQTYGGRNLIAEVISGPYNFNRIIGMDYNYFVYPLFANYNISLIVRNGELVDTIVENYPIQIEWNGIPYILE